MVPRWLVQVLHPRQKFDRLPCWNGCSLVIKNDGIEVTFMAWPPLLNFIEIEQLAQKFIVEGQTNRQDGDHISLFFSP
jgi:hypothetical protein